MPRPVEAWGSEPALRPLHYVVPFLFDPHREDVAVRSKARVRSSAEEDERGVGDDGAASHPAPFYAGFFGAVPAAVFIVAATSACLYPPLWLETQVRALVEGLIAAAVVGLLLGAADSARQGP